MPTKSGNSGRKITPKEVEALLDRDEEVVDHFGQAMVRHGFDKNEVLQKAVRKVNVDFSLEMLKDLDKEADYLNVSRQAVIKTAVQDKLRSGRVNRAAASGARAKKR